MIGLHQRLPFAWVASLILALLVGMSLWGTAPLSSDDAMSLAGPWRASIEESGQPARDGTVTLPGLFALQGIDPNARVHAHRTVQLPASNEPWLLHLEVPRYAVVVRWDGVEVARGGDPDAEGPDALRSDASLLAMLPADPVGGPHDLELDVRGDLHRGGVVGQIRAGPARTMLGSLQMEVGGRLGFALAFSIVATLHILGALRLHIRWNELYFGLFTLCVAGYALEHASASVAFTTDPTLRHLLRRVFVGGMVGFPVLFSAYFVYGKASRPHQIWGGLALTSVLVAFISPWFSARMENMQDGMVFVAALWLLKSALSAWQLHTPGSRWFLAAVCIAMFGAIDEVLVTNGLLPGARWLYPCLTLFLLFGSLAVVEQDRALSARHRRLITGTTDAMVELDKTGTVLQLNPAAQAFMPGLRGGQTIHDLLPVAMRPLLAAHIGQVGSRASVQEFELLDGRIVESIATPLDAATTLLVLRDVTRRRRADDDLIQAARLETAGMLVGGVAHDFNNLLSTLLGHVGLMRLSATPTAKERLDRMENAIERASLITRRLLAVGGRAESTSTNIDVETVLDEVAEIGEPALPEGVRLVIAVDGPMPSVLFADEDLRHVLLNLILNARDAVGETGTIQVHTELFEEGVRISVSDDGPGVPAELAERIFEPFFTTKGPNRGTGLGLPMAQRLVRRHGGTLTLIPDGPGATFALELLQATARPAPIHHPKGAVVAVVDDEDAIRGAFSDALTRSGYAVQSFASGQEALATLANAPPDVLVTDVVMPGMSGLQLAAALRDLYPSLPVVIVSGYVPASERSLEPPMEHLDKPVRPQRIAEAVGRLLTTADRARASQ